MDSGQINIDRFRDDKNISFVGVLVDHSYSAQKCLTTFYEYSRANTSKVQLRLYLDYLKETQLVKIYYHIRPKEYPALVHVSFANRTLLVSIREGEFTADDLHTFVEKPLQNEEL